MRFLRLAREKRASTAAILAVGGGFRKIAGVALLDRGGGIEGKMRRSHGVGGVENRNCRSAEFVPNP